jgi:hypothetical protein
VKHAFDRVRLRFVPRRPDGTDADVEHLATVWRRLWDLDCGHDHECGEYLDRNAAVCDARQRVSVRQEGRVYRRLHREGPTDPVNPGPGWAR